MANNPNLDIRLERTRSWITMAKAANSSEHARFIFYWIAFNCMYGLPPIDPDNLDREPESQMREIDEFLARVKEMDRVDREKKIGILDKAILKCRSDAETLIKDPFLSYQYWEGEKSPPSIQSACNADWEHVKDALDKGFVYDSFLHFTFFRLTVLRNQIIHGSATASPQSKGYESLKPGVRFLQVMVLALFDLLEAHGDRITKWPKAPYPRKGHIEHPHL